MKFLIFFCAVIIGTQAVNIFDLVQEQWEAFKLAHNKEYGSDTEERFRLKIFMENSHKVAKHNKLYSMGLVSYKLGINKYSDMLHNEFVYILNGFNNTKQKELKFGKGKDSITFISPANVDLPDEVDWTQHGAVTEIKDQGNCGSCWSFSATGALEGQHFRKTGQLVSLSEQNLIDCSGDYGNDGCNGGFFQDAFTYIKYNGGIDTEASYPYHARNEKCHYKPANIGATDNGFVNLPTGDEEQLKAAVATIGPISVAIDASLESFQQYSDGIYYEPACSSAAYQLDHAVLAVGYGTDENGQDYWLVKNSWGTTWGINGYIKMARNRNNACGIASEASYPLV